MFFSIIIPTTGRTRSVSHALSSIFEQTYPLWEAIIVGIPGEQHEVGIRPLLTQDRRIRYMTIPHNTLTEARTLGISAARGDVITFLDPDDYIAPTHLQTHHDFFLEHPRVDMVFGKPTIIGSPYIEDPHSPTHYSHVNDAPVHGTFFIKEHVFDRIKHMPHVPHGGLLHELIKNHQFVTRQIPMPTYIYDRTNQA